MNKKAPSQVAARLAESVAELLSEEDVFHPVQGDWTGRVSLRRQFVREIRVLLQNGLEIKGYCGNISDEGIELKTLSEIQQFTEAILEVRSLKYPCKPYRFTAQCRWCENQGVGGVSSGWTLLSVR